MPFFEATAQAFSCEFREISKNTFFTEHLRWLLLFVSEKYVLTLSVVKNFRKLPYRNLGIEIFRSAASNFTKNFSLCSIEGTFLQLVSLFLNYFNQLSTFLFSKTWERLKILSTQLIFGYFGNRKYHWITGEVFQIQYR